MTHIDSPSIAYAPAKRKSNWFDSPRAHHAMIDALLDIEPPRAMSNTLRATSDDYKALLEYSRKIAAVFDTRLSTLGTEANYHRCDDPLDLTVFASPASDSIEGDATHELEAEIERLEARGL